VLLLLVRRCLYPEPGAMRLSAEAWNRAMGKLVIDLSDERPFFDADKSDVPEKSTAVTGYHAVSDESEGDGVEFLSGNGLARKRSEFFKRRLLLQVIELLVSHDVYLQRLGRGHCLCL
jgi:hypothetical protein